MALFFGLVGAAFAGTPLRLLVVTFGWRDTMLASAAAAFAVCIGIWWTVRDHPAQKGYAGFTEPTGKAADRACRGIVSGLAAVLRYRNVRLLFVIGGGIVGCVLTFGGLWGVPYLSMHHGLSTPQAAALNSALLVAWGVGGPVFGGLSDRIGRRKPLFFAGLSLTAIGWSFILFWPQIPATALTVLLLVTGFSSGCVIISFAFVRESVPAHLVGTVIGLNNMGFMLGPTLLQPAVGWMLDRNWGGDLVQGVRIYDQAAYRVGFSLMMAWVAAALVLLFFTRETFCRRDRRLN
jgi:MFS family permease